MHARHGGVRDRRVGHRFRPELPHRVHGAVPVRVQRVCRRRDVPDGDGDGEHEAEVLVRGVGDQSGVFSRLARGFLLAVFH